MSFLVTGGARFIRPHGVQALPENGAVVTQFDDLSSRKREKLGDWTSPTMGDVRGMKAGAASDTGDVDCVFHLAVQINLRRAVEVSQVEAPFNVGSTINVLNVCVDGHVRWIVMSSTGGALYDKPSTSSANEHSPVRLLSPYGVSKYSAEQYIEYFHRMRGLAAAILRYANICGARQDPNGEAGVVSIFSPHILLGLQCTVYSEGEEAGLTSGRVAGRRPRSDAGVGQDMSLGLDCPMDFLYARRAFTVLRVLQLCRRGSVVCQSPSQQS